MYLALSLAALVDERARGARAARGAAVAGAGAPRAAPRRASGSSASGPGAAPTTSSTNTPWSAPRSPGSAGTSRRPSGSTSRPSRRRGRAASSSTRPSPASSPPRFYRDARPRPRPPTPTCEKARAAYFRWGAHAKVEQLDQRYPHLVERKPIAPTVTFAVRAEQFDVLSVVKASQSISGELKLPRLLEMLLRIVVEHAGAGEGVVLLVREDRLSTAAAIATSRGAARLLDAGEAAAAALPQSILNYVRRSHERVLLDDAAGQAPVLGGRVFRRARGRDRCCASRSCGRPGCSACSTWRTGSSPGRSPPGGSPCSSCSPRSRPSRSRTPCSMPISSRRTPSGGGRSRR